MFLNVCMTKLMIVGHNSTNHAYGDINNTPLVNGEAANSSGKIEVEVLNFEFYAIFKVEYDTCYGENQCEGSSFSINIMLLSQL